MVFPKPRCDPEDRVGYCASAAQSCYAPRLVLQEELFLIYVENKEIMLSALRLVLQEKLFFYLCGI